MNILVINGPNLNMLGTRNPDIYGIISLKELEFSLIKKYKDIKCLQSNSEGEIISFIQSTDCPIIINAGAYSHYSYAIRDAIECINFPVVEVHISNVNKREKFRHNLVLSDVCKKTIIGHGIKGYFEAAEYLLNNYKED